MATPVTLQEILWTSMRRHADLPAQAWHEDGVWKERTYSELGQAVRTTGHGLLALGLKDGDRVAIWSKNLPRWAEVDLADQSLGLVTVPIYDTLTADKAAYILNDAGVKVLFVQDEQILERYHRAAKTPKSVKHVVLLQGSAEGTMGYEEFLALGEKDAQKDPDRFDELAAKVEPDDLASLVYTSGTTGDPKGVMLTQWNFASNALACKKCVDFGPGDVFLSFLPLSHVFERTGGHFAAYAAGAKVAIARSIDTLVDDMQQVHPTLMMSVPRLYEKIHARILDNVARSSAIKRAIFSRAIRAGRAANVHRQRNEEIPKGLQRRLRLADRLVFHKLKARVGGRMRFFVSGGAALSKEIEEFFWAAGIPILQGYGLTETSPVTNVNLPHQLRFGSVGKTIEDVELRIDDSEWPRTRDVKEGEICFKGPNVMQGYWKREKDTKEVFDKDGWFHTGDIGYVDDDGFLFITDRKKEIIVMSNGKNVAPQPIEGALKLKPHIAMACVVGNGRKYMAALISPDLEALNEFALKNGIAAEDPERLVADQRVVSLIEREVEEVNQDLSRYEQIKKFWIVPVEWSPETDELTPTLKIKRRVIEQKYAKELKRLYPDG